MKFDKGFIDVKVINGISNQLLLLMDAHAEAEHLGTHDSAPAGGVPGMHSSRQSHFSATIIDSLLPTHEWSPSGSFPDQTYLFRDHPAH